MLKLRRGVVVGADPLEVEVAGRRRTAWADAARVGEVRIGDEVIVNVAAVDLALGSGGFDVVHVNLSRGLEGSGPQGAHVMKLNYTSLQHPVEPLEPELEVEGEVGAIPAMPVLVIHLHGQLAPVVWAAMAEREDARIGFIQTPGGALPGSLSHDVAELRGRGLLAGHITAGPCHGGDFEAISVAGGIDAAARHLGWDACVAGPGPGILGSASRLGHGAMAALDTAHTAMALGLPTLLAPRLSSTDARPRHRGLSHHSRTVLELLLAPVRVPVPEIETEGWPLLGPDAPEGGSRDAALADLIAVTKGKHDMTVKPVDLDGYR
ncbi:MAG: DUF3866 family protein, partial [Actinomycetota bacterium]|nr:DUF3866 family protein [Actinomycetota bacterium]